MYEAIRYTDEAATTMPMNLDSFIEHLQRMKARANDAGCYNAEVLMMQKDNDGAFKFFVRGEASQRGEKMNKPFQEELKDLLKIHGKDADAYLPDYAVAKYLEQCLDTLIEARNTPDGWYKRIAKRFRKIRRGYVLVESCENEWLKKYFTKFKANATSCSSRKIND